MFLELAGIRISDLENEGSVSYVPSAEFYPETGHLSARRVFEGAQRLLMQAKTSGFKSARLICFADFENLPASSTPNQIIAYERRIGLTCPVQVSAMCSYDAGQVAQIDGGEFLIEILQAHGHNIFKGLASARQ